MRRIASILAITGLLVSAAVALGELTSAPTAPEHSRPRLPERRESFRISGSVENLFPGASAQLRLKLRNPHPFKIIVRRIRVRVADAGPGCPASNLSVPRFRGRVQLRAKRRKRLALPMTMAPATPSFCQNAVFPLTYGGRAVDARTSFRSPTAAGR